VSASRKWSDEHPTRLVAGSLEMGAGSETIRGLPPFKYLGDIDWRQLIGSPESVPQNFEWTIVSDVTLPEPGTPRKRSSSGWRTLTYDAVAETLQR
jgi:hypothetical protein